MRILFLRFVFLLLILPARFVECDAAIHQLKQALTSRNKELYSKLTQNEQNESRFFDELLAFPYRTVSFGEPKIVEGKTMMQIFFQGEDQARYETWTFKIEKDFLSEKQVISSVDGLYRLRLNRAEIPVVRATVKHMDASFVLESGSLFTISAGGDLAGVLFMGKGSMTFAPPDKIEQQQLKLFAKNPVFQTNISNIYFRGSQRTLQKLFGQHLEKQRNVNSSPFYDEAQALVKSYNLEGYNVRVPLSKEYWFPRIFAGEVVAEIKSDNGRLFYQFSPTEKEDVLLADRDDGRVLSLYKGSSVRLTLLDSRGDFEDVHYALDMEVDPFSKNFKTRAVVKMQASKNITDMIFKLNNVLEVSNVTSNQGPLIFYQEKSNSNLHVVLNEKTEDGTDLSIEITYEGKLTPETPRNEAFQSGPTMDSELYLPPTYLYSHLSNWYPQLASRPYATLSAAVTVPESWVAITNGKPGEIEVVGRIKKFHYSSKVPMKYFSLIVGKLSGVYDAKSAIPIRVFYHDIDRSNAPKQAAIAEKILLYYSKYFGKYPFESLTIILRPVLTPGGHAPASIVLVNRVYEFFHLPFQKDPVNLVDFPEFFLAHEIGHQWWGQTVGWDGYRDQWLSESFAHFAATEYTIDTQKGDPWNRLSTIFTEWIRNKTYAGPIVLGSRLGHIAADPQAYSALLYNKGAYVLMMLKNIVGEEKFAEALSEFYDEYKFKLARTQDFENIVELKAGVELHEFFQQWLYRWDMPQVDWNYQTASSGKTVHLRLTQEKEHFYKLTIPVVIRGSGNESFTTTVLVDKPLFETDITVPFAARNVDLDPQRHVLMLKQRKKS